MWSDEASRLALLELWASGSLRQRKRQAEAWVDLAKLPWTRRTGRRDELSLAEDSRDKLEILLDRCFPGWRDALRDLGRAGLPADLNGWRQLQELHRGAALPPSLPPRLNQRTATAALGVHSKATLGERLRAALGPLEVTRDSLEKHNETEPWKDIAARFHVTGQVLLWLGAVILIVGGLLTFKSLDAYYERTERLLSVLGPLTLTTGFWSIVLWQILHVFSEAGRSK